MTAIWNNVAPAIMFIVPLGIMFTVPTYFWRNK